jgi:acetyl esterase/lipase
MMKRTLTNRFWRFLLKRMFQGKHLTIAEYRAQSISAARFMSRPPNDIEVEKINVAGLQAAWIRSANADKSKVVLHLHGGGYVTGGIASHLMMCIPMAQTLRMNVFLPEYRLAPENPFPAALEDVTKIYHWLLKQGYNSSNIIISGDSAGGGLSLATVLSLHDHHDPLPAAIVCMSPWVDLTMRGQSHITNAKEDVILKTETLKEWADYYVGTEKPEHPLISPIFADLHDLPPLFIQVGSDEILLDDSISLAKAAPNTTLKIWDGMWHDWHVFGALIPESKKAFEEIKQFIHTQFENSVKNK